MLEPLSEALITQTKAGLGNTWVKLAYDLDGSSLAGIVGQSVVLTESTIGLPASPDAPEGATGLAPASMALRGALGALMM